jgi:hypothetical protein
MTWFTPVSPLRAAGDERPDVTRCRSTHRHIAAVAVILAGAACSDDPQSPTTRIVPAEVVWMEWFDRVPQGGDLGVRVVVHAPCGRAHIGIGRDSSRIVVRAEEALNLDGSCTAGSRQLTDTVLPMPLLPFDESGTTHYALLAPVRHGSTVQPALTIVGEVVLDPSGPPPDSPFATGRVQLTVEEGCVRAERALGPQHGYLIINPPSILNATGSWSALLAGHLTPVDAAQCGSTIGLRLRSLQLDVLTGS